MLYDTTTTIGNSALRRKLDAAKKATGRPLKDFTVLAPQNDPFRIDTPARHRDGKWLRDTVQELGLGTRLIHWRGMHYMVLGWPKPDGTRYTNTDEDWVWLSGDAGKAARWLGYIDFDQIVDQRNAAPVIFEHGLMPPGVVADTGLDDIVLPDLDEGLVPTVTPLGFAVQQPYRLVMFGEKSSLEDVLLPLARRYSADLYLPTGEISDTLLHRMASNGAEDGRPMVVLCFSDCDPAGWQMPISIARKLQAFETSMYPDLEFEVRRVVLTPDDVREHGLPSTPLKDTEKRADKWRDSMGVEQTEIDALASLRPDLLRSVARHAIEEFVDTTLDAKVASARAAWKAEAQARIDGAMTDLDLPSFADTLAGKIDALNTELWEVRHRIWDTINTVELPTVQLPAAVSTGGSGRPLISSTWDFEAQCDALLRSKSYEREEVATWNW